MKHAAWPAQIAALLLAAHALDAGATSGRGDALDNRCASKPARASPPQQSRPYRASGWDCAICHSGGLNALGQAARSGGNPAAMDPYCVNTRPSSASITAPAAGASVAPGGRLTFSASGSDPDGFGLGYAWTLSNGAKLSGQTATYTVPANAAGTITATLTVKDPDGAAAASAPTRSITVARSTPAGPVANPDNYSAQKDKALAVAAPGVLANDTGGKLAAQLVARPQNARVFSLRADGGFSYTPKAGFTGADSFTYKAKLGTKLSVAATVSIRVASAAGPCPDKDRDGYSPEGKSCGPVDCNDNNAAVTACVPAKACVNALLAKRVRIDAAAWSGGTLTVAGGKAAKNAAVRVYNAVGGALLGTARAQDSGAWSFRRTGLAAAPCRVRVDIGGLSGQRKVAGAPAACRSSGEPVCAARPPSGNGNTGGNTGNNGNNGNSGGGIVRWDDDGHDHDDDHGGGHDDYDDDHGGGHDDHDDDHGGDHDDHDDDGEHHQGGHYDDD